MNEKKYYSVPYISNSTLTWFKVSPKYCWRRMNREIADAEKSYSLLGKQLHLSLLEPEEFEKTYTYLDFKTPTSKQQQTFCEDYVKIYNNPGLYGILNENEVLLQAYQNSYISEKRSAEAMLKSAKLLFENNSEYIKYLKIRGDYREVLSKSRQELITTITNAINSHKKASALMSNEFLGTVSAYNEFAIYWDYPIYINNEPLKCKSLIDRLVVDTINKKVTIVDLKTTSTLGDLTSQIDVRQYYRQLAFYRLAVQHSKLIPNDYEIDAYIVAVTTQDPYECKVYKLSDAEYAKQVLEINKLMEQISWHWFTNQWDYSRTYYEGDGTENLIDEYSNKSIERSEDDRSNEISLADVVF
jgi:hypothetical protein